MPGGGTVQCLVPCGGSEHAVVAHERQQRAVDRDDQRSAVADQRAALRVEDLAASAAQGLTAGIPLMHPWANRLSRTESHQAVESLPHVGRARRGREREVLPHGQCREEPGVLEGATEPETRARGGPIDSQH